MSGIGERLGRILSPTGSLMEFVGKVGDFLILSILWLVCCLPVITIGASTTAMFYVSFRLLAGEEEGCFRDFFRSFKENFRQATLLWLAALLLGAFLGLDLYFYLMWSAAGEWIGTGLFAIFAAATVLYLCVMLYLFPYVARFRCTFRTAVRNTAYLSLRHIPYTLAMMAADLLLTILCLQVGVLLAALPGMIAFVNGLCLSRVFSRYLPGKASEETESKNQTASR
ncbi:MAG: YesL family protein [Firmicutes bacterium]|nr:YesL family protein [Bacillota bacterium]